MSSNLAIKLRTGTQKAHTAAENVGFTKCFVKGVVDRACFAKFLGNLYCVYSTLENALQTHSEHPLIKPLYFKQLNRQANLIQDLEFYYGKNWQNFISASPATQIYVDRVKAVAATEPVLLLGHAYTRYMGDLSGGQMFQKLAQSALKLVDYQGTSFYYFEHIPDKAAFKDQYRKALNALPVDDITADKIVKEANDSFQFNMMMAKDLDSYLIQAIGQELFNSLTNTQTPGSTELAHHSK
ncbi:heme oxygenase (biliverdin-producing) [Calothrix sp. PCC 6303]|uniref:biliverdin-producing heme oxygenase n=1 Tax=Calothrix sp. PCC 6303 TaxID=1170562 RepID=UPI0002A04A8A|nr:heme oxygenase (biliverdin-producing) [Calothrix sp. PCC 6303]AFY99581.1 Heme oxygenase [Calothrix sp. PCC 6303]